MTELVPYFIVFLGGVVSVFSPCVLPLIPIYFSIISKNSKNIFLNICILLLGFISAFFLMQILVYKFTNTISSLFGEFYSNEILGILMIIFSFHTMGILKLNILNTEKRKELPENFNKKGYMFPLLLGFTLGLGWTPCTGPILFTVIGYTTTAKSMFGALAIMGSYAMGFALPFLILAILIVKFKKTTYFLNKYLNIIQKISGILLLIIGIAMFFNKLTLLYFI